MSVCEKDPPVPADVSEYAEKQTTTRLDGSLDNTGGPPRTPTQTCATATVTLCKDVDTNLRLQKAAKILLKNQKPSTARAPDVATTRLDPQVEEAKKVLEKELGKCIELPESNTFASSLYHHLAPDEEIEHFLAGTDVYNSAEHRWALPKSHEGLKEERMYKPLVKLLNAIFQWFWHETNLRKAVDTHSTQLPHKEFADTNNYSRPDITIKAKGPSFQLPQDKTIGYSNMATCFEVKVTNQGWSVVKELLQLAGYARQIFIQQPNRRFVRALIITEENFRLFHFDRSGVQYTQTINIHEEAHTFVRLVLGLSSLVESDLGLDTSIKWEIQDGRKIGGTLTTRNGNNAEVEYRLAEVDPVSSSYKIRDRGVICWRVIDPKSGDIMLVKEIWRAEDRLSEDFYLEMAKGVPGVVQMISFEYNRGDTKQFRGFDGPPPSDFRNRVAVRIVLDTEGKSIEHFKSPKELLCALRDAIDGHRELSLKNALHGRITLANVVLGKPDAPPGYRGLLMGLDMAVLNKMDASNLSAEPMAITEIYQSIAEIRRVHGIHQNPLAHSYLDDLESFVYVLTRIMYGYDHTGTKNDLYRILLQWGLRRGEGEADSKADYLGNGYVEIDSDVEKRWPPSCIDLILGFKGFLSKMNWEKMWVVQGRGFKASKQAFKALTIQLPMQYKTILDLFDTAIRKIESGDDKIPPSPSPDDQVRSSSPDNDPESSSPFMISNTHTSSPFTNPQSPLSRPQTDARNFLKRIPMGPRTISQEPSAVLDPSSDKSDSNALQHPAS